jgi:hypothetical protein
MPLAKSLSLKSLSILKTKKERPYLPAGPLSEGNLIFSMPYAAAAFRTIAAFGTSSPQFLLSCVRLASASGRNLLGKNSS